MTQSNTLRRYAIILIVVFCSTVAAFSYLALIQIKQTTLENTKDSLQTVLLTVQEAHHILVEQRRVAINSISKTERIVELTQELLELHKANLDLIDSPPLKTLRTLISPVLEEFGDQGFFIISPERISIASMRNVNMGSNNVINVNHPVLLDRAFDGESVFIPPIKSDVVLINESGDGHSNSTMFITSPIKDSDDNIIAVFALRINPMSYFSKITMIGRLGQSGETYAFNKSGILLTESRFVEQLRKINLIDLSESSTLNVHLKDPGGNLLEGFIPQVLPQNLPYTLMAAQALKGHSGFNIDGYRDYRGVVVLGAWLWDKRYHFGLATEINQKEALTSYHKTKNTFVLVITITIIMSVLMLWILYLIQRQTELKILQTNEQLEARVDERTQDLVLAKETLSNLNNELEVLAITDSLTHLNNRRFFDQQYRIEWKRCMRDKKSIAIILFDIDFFKQYNDFYGHLAGDRCLTTIGDFLSNAHVTKRPSDIIARYGGEEFILMLSNPSKDYCREVAQFLCDGIRKLALPHEKSGLADCPFVTISVGYALASSLNDGGHTQLISKADKALYQAKKFGRKRIVEYLDDKGKNVTNIHGR